ncbi:MAG: hypothetical protein ACI4UK_07825 [Floccifex sp.]
MDLEIQYYQDLLSYLISIQNQSSSLTSSNQEQNYIYSSLCSLISLVQNQIQLLYEHRNTES